MGARSVCGHIHDERGSWSLIVVRISKPISYLFLNHSIGGIQLVAVIDKEKCTGCETCVDICPTAAISMNDGKAVVDADTCVDCETCVDECPAEAIHME